jgi:hypothetical protein
MNAPCDRALRTTSTSGALTRHATPLAARHTQVDALQAKLCHMLGRSLYIDVHTAQFYLEDAGGDVKAAMHAFGAWCVRSAARRAQQRGAPSASPVPQHTL